MKDFFAEKSHQVEPGAFVAFGIEISSRYCQAGELVELIEFAEQAARRNVAHYVKRVFYDSKVCMCSFELDPAVKDGDAVATLILEAASETVGQFDWFGKVQHGGDLAKQVYATNDD